MGNKKQTNRKTSIKYQTRVGATIRLPDASLFLFPLKKTDKIRVLIPISKYLIIVLHNVSSQIFNENIAATVHKELITFTIIAAYTLSCSTLYRLRLTEVIQQPLSPHILRRDSNGYR